MRSPETRGRSPIERMVDEACGVTEPAVAAPVRFAVFDALDDCWLGVNPEGTGPKVYADRETAAFSCEMARRLLGFSDGRLVVLPYTSHGKQLEPSTFTAEIADVFDAMEAEGLLTENVVASLLTPPQAIHGEAA